METLNKQLVIMIRKSGLRVFTIERFDYTLEPL